MRIVGDENKRDEEQNPSLVRLEEKGHLFLTYLRSPFGSYLFLSFKWILDDSLPYIGKLAPFLCFSLLTFL